MRRSDRMINCEEAVEILNRSEYGILSTVDENNVPYGVPLSFVYSDGVVYFHCAKDVGQKMKNIKNNSNACFTVVNDVCLLPDKFSTKYSSVIAVGTISIVEDNEEKAKGLELLIKKLSPDYIEAGMKYINTSIDKTSVLRLDIKEMTGKARK